MADAFFNTFEDFEQEWTELGKEFQAVFDSGLVRLFKICNFLKQYKL